MTTQKVIPMKQTIQATALLLFLTGPASLLAQEPATAETASQAAASAPTPAITAGGSPATPCPRHGMGMMHQGKGPQGGGHGDMQHGGCRGKGRHTGDQQVIQRLDLIEARLARIEAMLEALIRR
jgi:hypothetical protein